MIDRNERLQSRKPSWEDQRGNAHLLAWGELGQWLVVDSEARELLRAFEEKNTTGDSLRSFAQSTGKNLDAVIAEASPVIEHLKSRKIIVPELDALPPIAEPRRIANITWNVTNRCNLNCPGATMPPATGKISPQQHWSIGSLPEKMYSIATRR